MAENKKYTIEVRMWIEETEGAFLGIGKIWLLENIRKTGSITNLCKRNENGLSSGLATG